MEMDMNKKRLTKILARADREDVIQMAERIEKESPVSVLRPAEKTLVMLKMKEPVKESAFYLGETIAAHCTVQMGGTAGAAVIMGDDLKRAYAAAVLDAAHQGEHPLFQSMLPTLYEMEKAQGMKRAQEAAKHKKTQVQFKILEDTER